MYIKIKSIKNFTLILACVCFASVNYLTYVKADSGNDSFGKKCDSAIDSDCDGLTNSEEKLYGTNASNPDTDGDGYSDGIEVKSGYNPVKAAPGDKMTDNLQDNTISTTENSTTLTDSFSQDLNNFISSKGTQSISTSDINSFVSENIANKTSSNITFDTLPEIDSSQIKILPQNYAGLSDAEKKSKMQQDAATYYYQIAYILESNAPSIILSKDDFESFLQNFSNHYATLASDSPDTLYFSDIANRMDLAVQQISDVQVPESMLSVHVKALRLVKGFLSLREDNYSPSDSISRMAMISKIQNLLTLTISFLNNDFQNYNKSLKN